jgi:hypothetical protein
MSISLVPVGSVAGVLPALLPHLQTSAQWTRGRATIDDILQMVLSGQMQLWAAHNERQIFGHVITEIKSYPRCKMLTIQYCAMEPGMLEQVEDEMQSVAARFAKDAGCAGVEFVGRPGWRDTAKKYGYEVQSVMYQKFFEVTK